MLSVNYITTFLNEPQNTIEKLYYNKIQFFERNETNIGSKLDANTNVEPNVEPNVDPKLDTNVESTLDTTNNPSFKEDFKKNSLEKYYQNIPEDFRNIFDKNIQSFYYDNKIYKNKSPIFTFINSILRIGNDIFNFYSESDKESYIKNFIKKIDEDLFEKNLYEIFNYNKNKYFNKSNIQEALKYGLQFKNNENFQLLKTYISDYLGINIIVFNLVNISASEKYLTKRFDNITKYVPSFLLCCENEIYKPILMKDNKIEQNISALIYSKHKNIIDNIFKYFNVEMNVEINVEMNLDNKNDIPQKLVEKIELPNIFKVNDNNAYDNSENNSENNVEIKKETKLNYSYFKNMKIDEIKEMCIKNNVSIQKKSDKTAKMINKLKNELIEDLIVIDNPIL